MPVKQVTKREFGELSRALRFSQLGNGGTRANPPENHVLLPFVITEEWSWGLVIEKGIRVITDKHGVFAIKLW